MRSHRLGGILYCWQAVNGSLCHKALSNMPRTSGNAVKSLIQFGNNVAPLTSSEPELENGRGLRLLGWFDFKAMMRFLGERCVESTAGKRVEAPHVLIEFSSSVRGRLEKRRPVPWCRALYCLGSWVCARGLAGNLVQPRDGWRLKRMFCWSPPVAPPGPYLKHLEEDGGRG